VRGDPSKIKGGTAVKETTVSVAQAVVAEQAVLPARVQEALGELVGAAREGLLALSVGVGLGVLAELMEEEVVEVVGPKGRQDPDRVAVRHGHEAGEVTLGGRRVGVERPRVRSADGRSELPLATYAHFTNRDPLTAVVLERMLAGVSTRRYRRTQEPIGATVEQAARSTSKSSVSRAFVERTREALGELMSRRLDDVRLAVLMLDGIELKGRTNIVALGISTDGIKIPLGLWEGSTENATVATALLSDLVERGLDPEQGMLFVVDGAKALRKAIRAVFGEAPVQRCIRHKERNVLDHLPERDRPAVKRRLRAAWAEGDHGRALDRLQTLAGELERTHPGAAGSLREGMTETLTLTRLGIRDNLKRTLESTNPCESMIECVRRTSRNVKRWQSGEMALRWTAAGMLEAERQFRRIIGYRDLAKLAVAIEYELTRRTIAHTPTEEAAILVTA
jgi:transposase-like protein